MCWTVYIPACVTKGGVDDLVYNDFYVGKDADVVIVAGCGVHTDSHETARHNGIHRFFIGENARVRLLKLKTEEFKSRRIVLWKQHVRYVE